jgi:hypothetical protein
LENFTLPYPDNKPITGPVDPQWVFRAEPAWIAT